MVPDRLVTLIGQETVEGWRLEAVDGDHAILKRPNYGSILGHIFVFVLTAWFTFGLGNVVFAAYRFLYSSEYRVVSVSEPTDHEEALTILRRRYASGELSEDEFERYVERLIETESIADLRRSMQYMESRSSITSEGITEKIH